MKSPARHNGRAARVRAWLQTQASPCTPAEIIAGCDPCSSIPHMCATLTSLVTNGFIERIGSGKGKVKFRLAPMQPSRRSGPKSTGSQEGRNLRRSAEANGPATNADSTCRPKSQKPSRILQATASPRRVQSTNFVAPLWTVVDPNSRKRHESACLAADIARFLSVGGLIERLPAGACADPLKHIHDR
jgi:hypothetical protein